MNEKSNAVKNLTLSAMFLAMGIILPFFTGQVPQIGNMLLPMHIPVFLCALICGWQYGVITAFILPLLRSFMFGMPILYPTAIAMAFELSAYAFVAGLMYKRFPWKCIRSLYMSLLSAMVIGRLVWGATEIILLGIQGNTFTIQVFIAGALLNAVPGIILQLILIPAVMVTLKRTRLVPLYKKSHQDILPESVKAYEERN